MDEMSCQIEVRACQNLRGHLLEGSLCPALAFVAFQRSQDALYCVMSEAVVDSGKVIKQPAGLCDVPCLLLNQGTAQVKPAVLARTDVCRYSNLHSFSAASGLWLHCWALHHAACLCS